MKVRTRNWLLRGSVLGALAVVLLLAWLHRGDVPVQAGQRPPNFRAPSLRGDTVDIAALRGRVLLVNAWATWCVPCRWEMPAIERLYQRLGPRGLVIVAVSEDQIGPESPGDPTGDVARFVAENGLSFTVLLDPRRRLQDAWGLAGLPTTFLIDRHGRIVRRVLGPAHWDQPPYSAEIERLLEG